MWAGEHGQAITTVSGAVSAVCCGISVVVPIAKIPT